MGARPSLLLGHTFDTSAAARLRDCASANSSIVGPDLQLVHKDLIEHGRFVASVSHVVTVAETEPDHVLFFNNPPQLIAGSVTRRPIGTEISLQINAPFSSSRSVFFKSPLRDVGAIHTK